MNRKGSGTGIILLLTLLAALLVSWLAMKNMSSLGFGGSAVQQNETPVQQAQNAVDQLNDKMQETSVEP